MKKFFFCLLALSTFAIISCNDDKTESSTTKSETNSKKDDTVTEADVPAAVTAAFKAKYPGATAVEWEKAKENDQPTFKAKWKSGNDKMKAEFGQDGTFIKEEKD